MTTFVLIHGMAHGGWCWDPISERLAAGGHTVHAPDLPLTGLVEDADAVIALLDSIEGPKVLVGHSYGGLVISRAAAARDDLTHLVYVAAAMLPADGLLPLLAVDYPDVGLNGAIAFTDDGWVEITDAEQAAVAFYASCDPADAAAAVARLRPTAVACVTTPTEAEPWTDIASTYVLCLKDDAIHPDFQRAMSASAATVVEIDTDHSPFMSTPDTLTEILTGVSA